jgi:hypothetical protein
LELQTQIAPQSKATPEVVGRATFLAQKMKNYKVLTFMFFMDDLLTIVSNLSLQFTHLVPDKFVGLIDFSSRDSAIVLNSLSALGE